MKFNSIKVKAILILLPLMTIPVLIVGGAGIVYYKDLIKEDIRNNNLGHARAISQLTARSLSLSTDYLEGLAVRPSVISALEGNNIIVLDTVLQAAAGHNNNFKTLYFADTNGTVISAFPGPGTEGLGYNVTNCVTPALSGAGSSVDIRDIRTNGHDSVLCMTVPVLDNDGSIVGSITGEIDLGRFANNVFETQATNQQYIYVVDETGRIVIHPDPQYMANRYDFSNAPPVSRVLSGEEGVIDAYNPIENDQRLSAYSPVPGVGWGVVVSIPVDVAYQPLVESSTLFSIFVLIVMVLSAIFAVLIGSSIVRPITGLIAATNRMTNGGDSYRYLPISRNDEIGDLARSFDDMSRRIIIDKARILEERNRAELYVDIMGHDINNLNQSALSNLELISDDKNLSEDQHESINSAITAVYGSAEIIGNVRKIQRINEEMLEPEANDINKLILDCIKEAHRPSGKKVVINYNSREKLLIRGSPLMKEVFCNLINDSIKYSGKEVVIDIIVTEETRISKKFYDIAVIDNGYGIPDEVKGKIFQRFQRGTTRAHGKGLGLYIVKQLIEKSGGSVKVENRVPGDYTKGTKMIVSLPACEDCNEQR